MSCFVDPKGKRHLLVKARYTNGGKGVVMKLWVDDLRLPPAGWEWAKSSHDAISLFADANVVIDEISLDHDLGGDDTSRKLVLWICEHDFCFPPIVHVHTANPVGREWLVSMVTRYGPGVA